jgi:hypothetical protein
LKWVGLRGAIRAMYCGCILFPSSNDGDASGMHRAHRSSWRMRNLIQATSANQPEENEMKQRAITFHSIGAAIVMSALVAGAATAAQMKAVGPQPGDCKRAYEAVNGPSLPVAQAMWVQLVASKYGNKWAQWAGAKNKSITPLGGSQFQARAMPCFYQPVP